MTKRVWRSGKAFIRTNQPLLHRSLKRLRTGIVPDFNCHRLYPNKEVADKAILNSSSLNWSGVIRNSTSYGANGVITIPTVYADSSHRPANCAGWVGIGGTSSSSALAQLGFDGVVSSSGAVSYNLWYETIGTNVSDAPIYITNISVSSGDNLFISVWLDYSAATGVNIVYYFFNQTRNCLGTL